MKLLFFTDTHIRMSKPRNRLDDFYETTLNKLEEIKNYANENKIDYVLHGGDLFDRPDSAIKPTSEVGKILSSFNMPIYIVAGNHDIFGYNTKTLNRTMLGLLDNFHVLNIIPEDGILLNSDEVSILVLGKDYSSDIDLNKENYIIKKSNLKYDADIVINIVHGFLTDRPFLKQVPHVLIGEITDTEADITLAGHYHTGFKTQYIDGKFFSNPGSMVRISNSLGEIKRKPKFLELNITKDNIVIKDVYLKSAKDGEEVLDRKALTESHYKDERLTIFSNSIDQNVDLELLNLDTILNEISKSENFDQDILKEAKLRLQYAKEIVNDYD